MAARVDDVRSLGVCVDSRHGRRSGGDLPDNSRHRRSLLAGLLAE